MALPRPIAPIATPNDELSARIRAGDERAFDALFRDYYNGLCVFAAHIVGSDAAAEEIVQDVLLRIWRRHARWEIYGSVAGYLYAAVRNRALNEIRAERFHEVQQEQVAIDAEITGIGGARISADERIRTGELAQAIDDAIQDLPPRCRQAFLLRRQHHLSYAEIARIMEISPKTVEIQIGNALKALRKKLADWL